MTSYKESGVDIRAKEQVIEEIKQSVSKTYTTDVIQTVTTFKFGGTMKIPKGYNEPILVVSTDSLGSKIMIAENTNMFETIGEDLVHQSVNDILTSGAKATYFLDYIASSKLDPKTIKKIVVSIAKACEKLGIVLAGGETAEIPDVYKEGRHDVVGMIGGFVEHSKIIDGSKIKKGNVIIGLASSGLHTNGYSLARKALECYKLEDRPDELEMSIAQALLKPHREYASILLPAIEKNLINGIAHITGGGLEGNIPRILPEGLGASIKKTSWQVPNIFKLIEKQGVTKDEMFRTFNMGIGIALIVDVKNKDTVIKMIPEKTYEIGLIVDGKGIQYANN